MLRPFSRHICAYTHGLTLPVRQRSPQPFYRAKLESPQPPHTHGDLDEEDGHGEEQAKRRSDLAEEREAVAVEDRGADERLELIVVERRAADRRQRREAPPPDLTLSQENDGGSIKERQGGCGNDQAQPSHVLHDRRGRRIERSSDRKRRVSRYADDQPPALHAPDEREMGGDIVEDPAPPGIQAQQEECEHIGIVDIRRYVPRQFARSEPDLLSIGPARVNAPVFVDRLLIVRLGLVRNPAFQWPTYSMGDRGVRRKAKEEQGNGEKRTSRHEQCLGRESAKEQQDKAILRVIMQDVAVPQE